MNRLIWAWYLMAWAAVIGGMAWEYARHRRWRRGHLRDLPEPGWLSGDDSGR